MTVVAKDVREFLNNISSQRVSDETIEKQIEVANTKISNERAESIDEHTFEEAVLTYASYLAYLAYVTEYERSVGVVPGFMVGHLQVLKDLAESFLRYVKAGSPTYAVPVDQPSTLRTQYLEGELEGDAY